MRLPIALVIAMSGMVWLSPSPAVAQPPQARTRDAAKEARKDAKQEQKDARKAAKNDRQQNPAWWHDRDNEQIRFRGMDRNRDGRITRAEWPGNRNSFDIHDWNNDGVLSGPELQPGRRLTVGTSGRQRQWDRSEAFRLFHDWDRNDDGRIGPTEWEGGRDAFRRLDDSHDGLLSRGEFMDIFGGADRRGDSFARLDRNYDGRLARGEWPFSSMFFDDLDDNNDGVLTRAEIKR